MAKQDLNGSKVSRLLVDQRGLGAPQGVRAIVLTPQANSGHPLIDQPSILSCTQMIGSIDGAWEDELLESTAAPLEPDKDRRSRRLKNFKLHRSLGRLLDFVSWTLIQVTQDRAIPKLSCHLPAVILTHSISAGRLPSTKNGH